MLINLQFSTFATSQIAPPLLLALLRVKVQLTTFNLLTRDTLPKSAPPLDLAILLVKLQLVTFKLVLAKIAPPLLLSPARLSLKTELITSPTPLQ